MTIIPLHLRRVDNHYSSELEPEMRVDEPLMTCPNLDSGVTTRFDGTERETYTRLVARDESSHPGCCNNNKYPSYAIGR